MFNFFQEVLWTQAKTDSKESLGKTHINKGRRGGGGENRGREQRTGFTYEHIRQVRLPSPVCKPDWKVQEKTRQTPLANSRRGFAGGGGGSDAVPRKDDLIFNSPREQPRNTDSKLI